MQIETIKWPSLFCDKGYIPEKPSYSALRFGIVVPWTTVQNAGAVIFNIQVISWFENY